MPVMHHALTVHRVGAGEQRQHAARFFGIRAFLIRYGGGQGGDRLRQDLTQGLMRIASSATTFWPSDAGTPGWRDSLPGVRSGDKLPVITQ
jgi:hypothetical protein